MKKVLVVAAMCCAVVLNAQAEREPPEKIIAKLGAQLCADHKHPAKCGRDISFIIGVATNVAHMDGYCLAGNESKSCSEARNAYKAFQDDFRKSKE